MITHKHIHKHEQTQKTQPQTLKHTHITDISQIMFFETKSCYRPAIPAPPPTPASPGSQQASQPAFSYAWKIRFSTVRSPTSLFFDCSAKARFCPHFDFLVHSREQTAICSLTSSPSSRLSPICGFCVRTMYMWTTPAQPSLLPSQNQRNQQNKCKSMNIQKSIKNNGIQWKSLETHENQTKQQKHIFKTSMQVQSIINATSTLMRIGHIKWTGLLQLKTNVVRIHHKMDATLMHIKIDHFLICTAAHVHTCFCADVHTFSNLGF